MGKRKEKNKMREIGKDARVDGQQGVRKRIMPNTGENESTEEGKRNTESGRI